MQVRPMRTISVRTPSTSCTACRVWDSTTQSNCPVGEGAQALVQVGLDHIQAAADAGEDLLLVQFHADQAPMVGLLQPGQQRAGAAAEVEHAGARRDQFDDAVVVEPVLVEDAGRAMRPRL